MIFYLYDLCNNYKYSAHLMRMEFLNAFYLTKFTIPIALRIFTQTVNLVQPTVSVINV